MAGTMYNLGLGRALIGLVLVMGLLAAPLSTAWGGRTPGCCCQAVDSASSRVKSGCHCRHDRPAGDWLWSKDPWGTVRTGVRPLHPGPLEAGTDLALLPAPRTPGPARARAHGPLRVRGTPLVKQAWRC
jgi:hypothetical protein